MPKYADPDNFNLEAAAVATEALLLFTDGRVRVPKTEEHWGVWLSVYEHNGGKVIEVEEEGASSSSVQMPCSKIESKPVPVPRKPKKPPPKIIPPLVLKIVELEFTSDHHVLVNTDDVPEPNDTPWSNKGERFAKPDWTIGGRSNPISHNKGKKVTVRVVIEAEGEAPDNGVISFKVGSTEYYRSGDMRFNIGRNELTLTSSKPFTVDSIGHKEITFKWFGETTRNPEPTSIGNTKNYVLVTFANPIGLLTEPDDGFTVKRMKAAIDLIKETDQTKVHDIVDKLMKKFPRYTLTTARSSDVPSIFRHPYYSKDDVGAWALADYVRFTAECQAICRFVRGVMNQVGYPGVEQVAVWAEPTKGGDDKFIVGGFVAKEAQFGFGGLTRFSRSVDKSFFREETYHEAEELGPLDKLWGTKPKMLVKKRQVRVEKKETWYARLTTSKPTLDADATRCGLNMYEACLKVTADGEVKYYGGGAGTYATKEKVVEAFHSLVWIQQIVDPDNLRAPDVNICKEIVKSWRL